MLYGKSHSFKKNRSLLKTIWLIINTNTNYENRRVFWELLRKRKLLVEAFKEYGTTPDFLCPLTNISKEILRKNLKLILENITNIFEKISQGIPSVISERDQGQIFERICWKFFDCVIFWPDFLNRWSADLSWGPWRFIKGSAKPLRIDVVFLVLKNKFEEFLNSHVLLESFINELQYVF